MTHTLNCRGRLLSLGQPRIMGILNLTPDSFSDGGRYMETPLAVARAGEMLAEGADILDIGAYSSRPGAADISEAEEIRRLYEPVREIRAQFPEAILSIDTFRPGVAAAMLDLGIHIINDIRAGEGSLDPAQDSETMMQLVGRAGNVPYIMMHMKGTPQTMQQKPEYAHVAEEVRAFFIDKIREARAQGIRDLILDPGLGFGKSILHNYQLLAALPRFTAFDLPVMVGISRKSMLYRLFQSGPEDTVGVASALHLRAIEAGARLLRVHDVREAARIVQLYLYLREHGLI
ncbi:MAG: dihydropteroate synthase [Bacteroidetes bacterium]|nr:MAG: dihydropteroate synthase [Bacteroidota bacterium]